MAAVTAAVVGAGAVAYSAKKASKAQSQATAAASDAAARQDELSREQFEWNKQIYERDVAPAERANRELQTRLTNDFLDTSAQQKRFAQEQRDEYVNTYLPNERRVVQEAQDFDSAGNVARRSGIAAANVNQQFSNATGQRSRLLTRFGMNPNSSTFARQAGEDSRAQALAAAGAQTGAAFDTVDKAIALRSGVANFGRNMPNTAANFFSGSNSSNQAASGASAAAVNSAMSAPSFMNNAYASRIGGIGASGALMSNALSNSASMWSDVTQGLGGMTGSLVNKAGGFDAVARGVGGLFKPGGFFGGPKVMDTANYTRDGYISGGV
jgi:hypothetical protein